MYLQATLSHSWHWLPQCSCFYLSGEHKKPQKIVCLSGGYFRLNTLTHSLLMASFALWWFIWYRLISTQNQHLSVRNNITPSSLALQRKWETYFDTAIDVLRQLINILSKCLYWSYIWAPSHFPGLHSRVCKENLNFDGYSHFVKMRSILPILKLSETQ